MVSIKMTCFSIEFAVDVRVPGSFDLNEGIICPRELNDDAHLVQAMISMAEVVPDEQYERIVH
jgi:hypothetical protein